MGAKDLARVTVKAVALERDLRNPREVRARDLYRLLRNHRMEKDLTRVTVKVVRPRNRRVEKGLTRATVKVVRPRNRRMEKDLTRATVKAVRPRNRRVEKDLRRAREDLVLAGKEPLRVRVLCR